MKFLPYVLKHLRRNRARTVLTVLALVFCMFLFCILQTLVHSVAVSLESANASRLVCRHAVSLIFNLPNAYRERIAAVPGVRQVAATTWFGGTRRPNDFTDFFPNFAVDAERYLEMYPEIILSEAQKRAFLQDRRGCIVGRETAERFGWKVGDTFQLESFIPPYRVGRPFEFLIDGIYDTDPIRYPGTLTTAMYFHYDYLYEMTGQAIGVGVFTIAIDDPARAAAVSKAVDALFENSSAQTKTETEAAFRAGFVSMAGNLTALLNSIGLAVIFAILLVTANTMSMAVRERRTEIAVLKTLGFSSLLVMALILAESVLLGMIGGGLGTLLGWGLIAALPKLPVIGSQIRGLFPNLAFSPAVGLLAFGTAILLGALAGFIPSALAYKARVTEMLRQV